MGLKTPASTPSAPDLHVYRRWSLLDTPNGVRWRWPRYLADRGVRLTVQLSTVGRPGDFLESHRRPRRDPRLMETPSRWKAVRTTSDGADSVPFGRKRSAVGSASGEWQRSATRATARIVDGRARGQRGPLTHPGAGAVVVAGVVGPMRTALVTGFEIAVACERSAVDTARPPHHGPESEQFRPP